MASKGNSGSWLAFGQSGKLVGGYLGSILVKAAQRYVNKQEEQKK